MTTLRAGNVVGNVITTWQEPPTGILDSLEAARRLVREAGQRYGLRHARYGKFFPAARLVVFREHHPEDIVQIADNLISLSVNSDEHRCCRDTPSEFLMETTLPRPNTGFWKLAGKPPLLCPVRR